MKKFMKGFSLLIAMLGVAFVANAQEDFMKRAFRDMKESAKLQHQIDRANFRAVKLETKAFYEEQKRLSKPSVRTAAQRERMQRELEMANKRVEEAKAKYDNAKE
jgi:hypothetical protein